jgi:DNA polymerase
MPDKIEQLRNLYDQNKNCTRCELCKTRTNFVFGGGNPDSFVLFVGEAPGADEDLQGKPFVGKSGQLLNNLLYYINKKRQEVFISNILHCRPENNRDPLPHEIQACRHIVERQIEIVKPRVICTLGRIAAQILLNTTEALGTLRMSIQRYHSIDVVTTYHPSAILRFSKYSFPTQQDFELLRKYL